MLTIGSFWIFWFEFYLKLSYIKIIVFGEKCTSPEKSKSLIQLWHWSTVLEWMYIVTFPSLPPCCWSSLWLSGSSIYSRRLVALLLEMKNTFLVGRSLILRISLKSCFCFFSRLLPETTTKVPTASWATCWAVGMTRACLACRPAVSWAWCRLWTARRRGNTSCWLQPLTQVRPQWRCLSCEGGWYHLEMFEGGFYAGLAVLCFSL